MFSEIQKDFKIYHVAKGVYLTSNNVVIDFCKISDRRYCSVSHVDNINVITLDSKPCKKQKEVLKVLTPFLSSFNFNMRINDIRDQVLGDGNEELFSAVQKHRDYINANAYEV
jgi:hypothetical protein